MCSGIQQIKLLRILEEMFAQAVFTFFIWVSQFVASGNFLNTPPGQSLKDFRSAIDLGYFQAKPLFPRRSSSCSPTISWPLWTYEQEPHPAGKKQLPCRAKACTAKSSLFLGFFWGLAAEISRGSRQHSRLPSPFAFWAAHAAHSMLWSS